MGRFQNSEYPVVADRGERLPEVEGRQHGKPPSNVIFHRGDTAYRIELKHILAKVAGRCIPSLRVMDELGKPTG
eukprot:9105553-Pyramimonas_sp.AAC.1